MIAAERLLDDLNHGADDRKDSKSPAATRASSLLKTLGPNVRNDGGANVSVEHRGHAENIQFVCPHHPIQNPGADGGLRIMASASETL
jgi:hypothetical protein